MVSRCEITAVSMSPKKIIHLELRRVLQHLPKWIYFCKAGGKSSLRTTFLRGKKWTQVQIVTSAPVSCTDVPRRAVKRVGAAMVCNERSYPKPWAGRLSVRGCSWQLLLCSSCATLGWREAARFWRWGGQIISRRYSCQLRWGGQDLFLDIRFLCKAMGVVSEVNSQRVPDTGAGPIFCKVSEFSLAFILGSLSRVITCCVCIESLVW